MILFSDAPVMLAAVSSGPKLWRIAALVLLLSAAFDIAAVDTALLGAASCCNGASDDACFCCCRNMVLVDAIALEPLMVAATFVDLRSPSAESVPSAVPHLPPRA
jgi:hypothetical protein